MARSRKGMLDDLTALPWPVGVIVGILFFAGITYGLPWWFGREGGMISQGIAQATGNLSFMAWFLLVMCWGAALVSWLQARKRRRQLDTRTDLESVAALGWRQFEDLVGESFRRRGYRLEDTGLGADGGIDLILHRDSKRVLVQCKHWRKQQVGVSVVREMYGLLAHHQADEVKIASLGTYTRDAARFAAGKPIELIDGETLLGMIREVQAEKSQTARRDPVGEPLASSLTSDSPPCSSCGRPTVRRRNRATGAVFLGCSGFPQCRGTV
jgi:restriction system protein